MKQKSYKDHAKTLARATIKHCGDSPRAAMMEACAFFASISNVLGKYHVPEIHRAWAARRAVRLGYTLHSWP